MTQTPQQASRTRTHLQETTESSKRRPHGRSARGQRHMHASLQAAVSVLNGTPSSTSSAAARVRAKARAQQPRRVRIVVRPAPLQPRPGPTSRPARPDRRPPALATLGLALQPDPHRQPLELRPGAAAAGVHNADDSMVAQVAGQRRKRDEEADYEELPDADDRERTPGAFRGGWQWALGWHPPSPDRTRSSERDLELRARRTRA